MVLAEQKGIRYKLVKPDLKSVDTDAGTVHAILSTENVDRDGDVIRQAHWDLKSFLAHPVIIDSHEYSGLNNVIGEWTNTKLVPALDAQGKQLKDAETGEDIFNLEGDANYFVGQNPQADYAFFLVGKGLGAYSVGFIPDYDKAIEMEGKSKGFLPGYEFRGQELLEASQVTIPSNRESLQAMIGERQARRALLREPSAAPIQPGFIAPEHLQKIAAIADDQAAILSLVNHMKADIEAWRGGPNAVAKYKREMRDAFEEASRNGN